MKLKHAFLALFLFVIPIVSQAEVDQDIPRTIATIAQEYNYNPQTALFLTWQESKWRNTTVGDEHLTCKRTGLPIRSRGVWQINNCSHPEVTDEQAFDVEWSTHWAMRTIIEDGGCRQWSVCKMLGVDT